MGKSKIIKEDGFIAIIALSIFLLLSLFGIIVQQVTTNTIQNVSTTNKYNEASDIADSVIEYLQYEMSQREAGFSMAEVGCVYEEGSGGGTNDPICYNVAGPLGLGDKDMEISMEVKGRNELGVDMLSGGGHFECPGIYSTDCYIVPHIGTGDAGVNCNLYQNTVENGNWNPRPTIWINDKGQEETDPAIPHINQIDYSCNWNKLSFGSSSTDRVAIPLYYDESSPDDSTPIIINPFMTVTPIAQRATEFSIRIRPPCKTSTSSADETICDDTDRYELDDSENDIVVQWQISGECGSEPCSLIPYVEYLSGGEIDDNFSSAITEAKINNDYNRNYIISTLTLPLGVDTRDYTDYIILNKLETDFEKPTLILFLNEKLIDIDDNNVPYLEYQILTDKPIGSPNTQAIATINIGGYVFEKTLNQQEQTSLIDFAVQN